MSRTFGRVAALLTASVSVVMAAPQTQPPSCSTAMRGRLRRGQVDAK